MAATETVADNPSSNSVPQGSVLLVSNLSVRQDSNSSSARPARTVRRANDAANAARADVKARAVADVANVAATAVLGPSTLPRARCVRAASYPPRKWPRARRHMRRGTPRPSPSNPWKARCASRTSTFLRRCCTASPTSASSTAPRSRRCRSRTPIQALSLQNALDGKNIAGKAQTGSGKTAAFLVAILTRYLRTPESRAKTGGTPRALVIAPTRELVIQICKDADAIGKYCGLRSLAVYGGMDMDRQREELQEAPVDLLVATPGRLLDFCQRHVVDLKSVDTLVIDEADRMLDMGFIPDVRRIMSHLPQKDKRATMLYSATLTDDVMRLASQWMEEPVKAEVESEHNATDTVRQIVYVIRSEDKFKVLFNHISLHPDARAIVFCNRKSTTEDVYESLKRRGVKCEMLSGDVSQNKRLQVLEGFRAGKIKIVVATDVAGRGIHVDDIEYVINFDFPYEAEDYVHRIGRTGRAGNTGIAISFADEDESFAIPEIEEYINEPLKCTIIQDDDPLLKPLEKLARGQTSTLKPVDEAAKAAVDAREAVTEEQKAAAAAMVGGLAVKTASGKTGFVRDDAITRKEPNLENALDPKPLADESDAYVKPIEQTARLEEWVPQQQIEGSGGPVQQNGEQAKNEQTTQKDE